MPASRWRPDASRTIDFTPHRTKAPRAEFATVRCASRCSRRCAQPLISWHPPRSRSRERGTTAFRPGSPPAGTRAALMIGRKAATRLRRAGIAVPRTLITIIARSSPITHQKTARNVAWRSAIHGPCALPMPTMPLAPTRALVWPWARVPPGKLKRRRAFIASSPLMFDLFGRRRGRRPPPSYRSAFTTREDHPPRSRWWAMRACSIHRRPGLNLGCAMSVLVEVFPEGRAWRYLAIAQLSPRRALARL